MTMTHTVAWRRPSGRLLAVHTGSVGLVGRTGLRSAIHKTARTGPVALGPNGLAGDDQAESFHGGPEKAVLHYAVEHYAAWRAEFPAAAERFRPGGFGENLVASGLTEADLCIGDIIAIGSAILQVSESRQPCFKLNHRFGDPGIARRAQETGRTGWLYRVLEAGEIMAGDDIVLVDRPLPEWPIARLQTYLYGAAGDLDMAAVLAELPHLSPGFRALFARRVAAGSPEDWSDRLSNGPVAARPPEWFRTEIDAVEALASDVNGYRLRRSDGQPLPAPIPGAHVQVRIADDLVRSYSLLPPQEPGSWRIAVRRRDDGRGASRRIHDEWRAGTVVMTSAQACHFPLRTADGPLRFLAAGIGITPFLTMIDAADAAGTPWRLDYLVRDSLEHSPTKLKDLGDERMLQVIESGAISCRPDDSVRSESALDAPFADALRARYPTRVFLHATGGDPSRRFDAASAFACPEPGVRLYCCGPEGLMRDVRSATASWPAGNVVFESFGLPAAEDAAAFEAEIEGTGRTLTIAPGISLLAALRGAGLPVDSGCESGTCGSCVVAVTAGRVEHRDVCLTETQRLQWMTSCVSRGRGTIRIALETAPAS